MNLWKAGILHCDVSVDNILLGSEGATVGNRGILIDFDMAIDISRVHVDSQYRTVSSHLDSTLYITPDDMK